MGVALYEPNDYARFVCREMSYKDGHIKGIFDDKEGVVYLPSRYSHKCSQAWSFKSYRV